MASIQSIFIFKIVSLSTILKCHEPIKEPY